MEWLRLTNEINTKVTITIKDSQPGYDNILTDGDQLSDEQLYVLFAILESHFALRIAAKKRLKDPNTQLLTPSITATPGKPSDKKQ